MSYVSKIFLAASLFTSATTQAVTLSELQTPSGVKVRSAFTHWEKIFTPNFCNPDAFVFSYKDKASSKTWEDVISFSLKETSEHKLQVISFTQLSTQDEVVEIASSMYHLMGMSPNEEFAGKLERVRQK